MIVLKPTTDPQTFRFIPRDYNTAEVVLFRDDTTNETIVYNATITKVGDYLEVTGVFDLVEGHFYDIRGCLCSGRSPLSQRRGFE